MPDRSFRDVLLGDKGLERKAITLNVIPGSEVILEDIFLDEDVKVNHPSSFKVVHFFLIYCASLFLFFFLILYHLFTF